MSGTKKRRVDFRRNRAQPAREKDWTRFAPGSGREEADPEASERVVAKGSLSRKRTVIVESDGFAGSPDAMRDGTVVTLFGLIAHVDDGERVWPCTIRGVLRTRRIGGRSAVTVGDRVAFSVAAERKGVESAGVIEAVAPRHGELKRITSRREQIVVANVDQVVIVTSADAPKSNLVDRYIVSSLHGSMQPVVCINKIDLVSEETVDRFLSIYDGLGYVTMRTSVIDGAGIDALRALLSGKASVIAGQSGVGKSSLLNAVQPGLALKTGSVIEDTSKGRHTTTRATLLNLDNGGYVVDTPGVRSFDLGCVPREQLEQYFQEFVAWVPHCKYADCVHIHEDGCAIKSAVKKGRINELRYESYVRLFTEPEFRINATT